METAIRYGLPLLGAIMAGGSYFWRKAVKRNLPKQPSTKQKLLSHLPTAFLIAGLWLFVVQMLMLLFGVKEHEAFTVSIWAERIQVGGYVISSSVLTTWVIMAVIILCAVLIRLLVIPRMTDTPKGLQNVLEIAVESICRFTNTSVGDLSSNLPAYLFSIALFMVGCAATELLGVRAPTADITVTFSLALITFILINYFGIKKKGIVGRIKSMSKPTPVVFIIKVVTDCAIPVSMACRLFGNMLGGMIVMELLYFALGNAAVGFPSVLGLYFNLFHPLIQAYIFITLTLTFIGEATEEDHE